MPVAQRAEFYVAYPNQPEKVEHIYSGTVLWRLENAGGADGGQLRPAIRGDVDFPDAKVKATILIQRNVDQALSASHTISIALKFLGGDVKGVSQIGNIELRRPDAQRGQPVAGIPVPINESNFLIGLMRGPAEARNVQLLRHPGDHRHSAEAFRQPPCDLQSRERRLRRTRLLRRAGRLGAVGRLWLGLTG